MAKKTYLLALDAGTTSVKTVLFDTTGHTIAVRVCEYNLERPNPDIVEANPEHYWKAACEGISGVLQEAGILPEEVAAAGVTSQGETLIVLDDKGRPLRNAVVWLDNRAKAEAEQIAARFTRDEVYRVTGQQDIVPTWTAAKILWLRRHEPEVFSKAAHFLLVEDYLIYRLTGQFVTDHALNPSTLYYDLIRGCWWPEMLDFLGIREDQLPELRNSGEVAGQARNGGLAPNTVITVAPIDQVAAATGAGNIAPGMLTETTGSALAICATVAHPVYDEKKQISLYRHALPGTYVMMPWTPTAGMALRWFRDELGGGLDYPALAALAEKVQPGCEGLLLLPHLSGAFCPDANPEARGVFYGVSLAHTRGHFVRAIFEAVAFLLRHNLEALQRSGLSCGKVLSLGGGARNPLWLQIKADVLYRTMIVPDCEESTCLGAAILAAVGAGIYPTLAEAAGQMVRSRMSFAPDREAAYNYDKVYKKYLQINQLLMPTFGENHDH